MMKLECKVPGQAKKISTRYLVPYQARPGTGIDTSWDLAVFLASDPECTNHLASSTVYRNISLLQSLDLINILLLLLLQLYSTTVVLVHMISKGNTISQIFKT